MAITGTELQAAAETATSSGSTGTVIQVTQGPISIDGIYDVFYVVGVTAPYAGRTMWCRTTKVLNANLQWQQVEAALLAGPVDVNAT
jgi:hypothetical protein